jgi:hypothetical protein
MGPRTGLNDVKRKFLTLPVLELRPFGRPSLSKSLDQLRYPGSHFRSISLQKKKKKGRQAQKNVNFMSANFLHRKCV